ncbi:unnamed protein product [Prorocentrum cordatum]|uniref:Ion transport domain-containing protein n=1 Tax=Prorocentrum cordatum TaxID=2364126 RepID=A0ABN9TP80_9DINO|nr:unnamed protein product [Polarella glacialis]
MPLPLPFALVIPLFRYGSGAQNSWAPPTSARAGGSRGPAPHAALAFPATAARARRGVRGFARGGSARRDAPCPPAAAAAGPGARGAGGPRRARRQRGARRLGGQLRERPAAGRRRRPPCQAGGQLESASLTSRPSLQPQMSSLYRNLRFDDIDARKTVDSIRASCRATTISSQTTDTRALAWFVQSRYFSVALASLIITSAVLIGVETQVLSIKSYQGSDSEEMLVALSWMNYCITFLFTLEMVARLYVFRFQFFLSETMWNCFDLIILILALVEVTLELVVRSSSSTDSFFDNGGTAKMMRLIRLTRLLRLVRTFRQLKPLRMLVRSIMAAGKSVFWALLLLFMIVYAFGVILTQAVTEHTKGGTNIDDERLRTHYGSLLRSMLSLTMAVSGGISWIELTTPLEFAGNPTWIMLFLIYIAIAYFFILNVVTGVFCQNAIEGAQQDLDMSIDAQLREKQMHAQRLGMLFQEMNEDSGAMSDGMTVDDLNLQLAKPKVQARWRIFGH